MFCLHDFGYGLVSRYSRETATCLNRYAVIIGLTRYTRFQFSDAKQMTALLGYYTRFQFSAAKQMTALFWVITQ